MWDLEFMQDISGKGASRLGVKYVSSRDKMEAPFKKTIRAELRQPRAFRDHSLK
jgi:hypothetical protein